MHVLLAQLAILMTQNGWRMASAESCTGGLIAAACTDLPGASGWFDRGWVTYANAAKTEQLGVAAPLIAAHGAVSEPVACAMALGALARADAHWALATSGVAGPEGGSADKPVGTVCLAWAWRIAGAHTAAQVRGLTRHFDGPRAQVRAAAQRAALQGLITQIDVQVAAQLPRPVR